MAAKQTGSFAGKARWGNASLSALALALGMGAGGVAFAQDDQAADEEIVVTGFRASLGAAIDIKRDETAAVDAIVAEDIADFPDLNLSESIQRIPGVSITRSNGEGRQISVRGLGAQFTRVRLNGMEAMSAEGSTDAEGGTNRGRNFDFNIFASELFNSITVRKTASAEIEEGSLGATVDLRTARPFDYNGFELATSFQMGTNNLTDSADPRVAFLISNTWGHDFGALFSFAYSDRESLEEGASTVRWQNDGTRADLVPAAGCLSANGCSTGNRFQTVMGLGAGATYDAVNEAFHPRIPRYDVYNHNQDRLGATLTLQWRPTDSTDVNLDVLYADHNATRTESFLESAVFSTSGANGMGAVDVTNYEIQGNTLVYGAFNDVDVRSEFRMDQLSSELRQIDLSVDHEFSDQLRAHLFAGSSRAEHDNPIQTTLLWDRADLDGYVYDYRDNNRLPLITYGGAAVDTAAFWESGGPQSSSNRLTQIRLRPQFVDNNFDTVYGSLEFDANEWLTLSGGLNWKNFEFTSVELRRSNGTTANQESSIPGFAGTTPLGNYVQIISLNGDGFDLPTGLVSSWAAPDITRAASLWDLYNTSVFPTGIGPALGNNYTITEEDRGAYVQADWNTMLAGMPFRGNIGVRYVETDQGTLGWTNQGAVPIQVSSERGYNDTLPSLNVVLEPAQDLLLRFGAAQVMTRPNLGQLNSGAAVTVSGSNRTVSRGNPNLDPFRATTFDLAAEWYFHEDALLSVAVFYKDIDSFIQTQRSDQVFTGNTFGIPDAVATAACPGGVNTLACNPGLTWQFSQPINTPGGPLEGYELSLQLPFFFLDGWLSNFGIVANYTHAESDIDYLDSLGNLQVTAPLTNLSEEAWNATVFYEDDRLSARISGAYRSDYLTTIPGRNGNTSESTASTFNVDFASSYQLSERVRLTLEGLNLTDEVSDQFISPDDRSSFYHHYGRQVMAGVRFTY